MNIFPIAPLGRRADQDMGVVGKLPENILVARSVLQGQDQSILSDQISVCRKRFSCDISFREKMIRSCASFSSPGSTALTLYKRSSSPRLTVIPFSFI
jgi:hypothetical protein